MLNKKYILLFLTLLISLVIANKRSYEKLDQKMLLSVFQPTHTIIDLKSKINLDNFSIYYIDQLYFPPNKEITHYKLGSLGFQKNLHVVIEMWVNTLIEGDYVFQFSTDSGIGLQIDDSAMTSHTFLDRYDKIRFTRRLTKGQHKITIIKIHREGEFTIKAKYRLKDNELSYNIGESSNLIEFIDLDYWGE